MTRRCNACGHHWPPTPEPFADPADIDALLADISASDVHAVCNAWLAEGVRAGVRWNPRVTQLQRHLEITRAAFALARLVAVDDDGETYARLILATALGTDLAEQPVVPVGVALGHLATDEARRVVAVARAFGDALTLMFSDDGQPLLVGDVAAVLAAA